ncbi:Superoxide dismutase copper/zinc binding domain [Trinorchestia longiramus]|nr:Superoxide dismutase copper/zinc binding domain [Trinorchestia longiramus]
MRWKLERIADRMPTVDTRQWHSSVHDRTIIIYERVLVNVVPKITEDCRCFYSCYNLKILAQKMKMLRSWLLLLLVVTLTYSQLSENHKPDALVEMVPGVDEKVFGKLALYKKDGGVFIEGIIHNLKPGFHGFHVHEKGLLGNKCMDAGEHFNPLNKVHAGPKDLHRHAGDLGNVHADHNGVAKINIFDGHISLHPEDKTYIGKRSFVVHKKPDDLGRGGNKESLRTGNAGGRLSCGIVIQLGHSLKEPPPVYNPKHSGHNDGFGVSGFSDGYGKVGRGGHGSDKHTNKHFRGFHDYDYDITDDKGYGQSGTSHFNSRQKRPNQVHEQDAFHSSGLFDVVNTDPYEGVGSFQSFQSIQKLPSLYHKRTSKESHQSPVLDFSQDILNFW